MNSLHNYELSCDFRPPNLFHNFSNISVFLIYRSSFRFFGQSSAPTPAVPVMTSSGRVAPVNVGDTVLLVEDVRYRVQKLFPADGTVVLQKINTRDRPFKRFISPAMGPSSCNG